jgi:hypothetical protein
MRLVAALLLCLAMSCSALAASPSFARAELLGEGTVLRLDRSDGSTAPAPRLEDQDSFGKPSVARNSKYVGWLALYPERGASYSQPLALVVMDRSNRIHRFSGAFGMVFGWCFTPESHAVVFKYAFPHGMTPVAFDMRRIEDGRLLRHFALDPVRPDADQDQVLQTKAPRWALCAQKSAREQ